MIQAVLPTEDGTANLALTLLALQTLSTTEVFVFAQIPAKDVYLGNSSTERNVFIIKAHVQREPNGMVQLVSLQLANAPTVTTKKETNASHSLKDVSQKQLGLTTDVFQQEEAAHMVPSEDLITVNLRTLAKEAKFGILLFSNVFVLEELDGAGKSVLFAQEAKSGTLLTAAHAPMDSS